MRMTDAPTDHGVAALIANERLPDRAACITAVTRNSRYQGVATVDQINVLDQWGFVTVHHSFPAMPGGARVVLSRGEARVVYELNSPRAEQREAVVVRHPSMNGMYTVCDIGCELGLRTMDGQSFLRADFRAPFAFRVGVCTVLVGHPQQPDFAADLLASKEHPLAVPYHAWLLGFSDHAQQWALSPRDLHAARVTADLELATRIAANDDRLTRTGFTAGDTRMHYLADAEPKQVQPLFVDTQQRGLLVGRGTHCPVPHPAMRDETLSRTHAVVLCLDGDLYLVDLAHRDSTLTTGGAPTWVCRVMPSQRFVLGKSLMLHFEPMHEDGVPR